VEPAKAAARELRAVDGNITLDFAGPDETPYEDWMGIY
jgi:hypothetical protein